MLALSWWRRLCRVTFQPQVNNIVVGLLTPEHPCQRLSLHALRILVQVSRLEGRVIFDGLLLAQLE